MLSRLANLSGLKLKIVIGLAGAALVAVFAALAVSMIENRHLSKMNAQLDARINDPVSGYERRLARSETNSQTLKLELEGQVRNLETKATADAARLAETTRALSIAKEETRRAEKRAKILLAQPPRGKTLEDRVRDVDARVLESLK